MAQFRTKNSFERPSLTLAVNVSSAHSPLCMNLNQRFISDLEFGDGVVHGVLDIFDDVLTRPLH